MALLGITAFFSLLALIYGCTLPNYLLDSDWDTSTLGQLKFNGSALGPYTVGPYGDYYFDCFLQVGSKYILRSTEKKTILSQEQYFYLCLDFRYQTNNKYLLYLKTTEEAAANNQRVKIVQATVAPTANQVCDATIPTEEFIIMVKTGMTASEKIPYPSMMLGEFVYNVTGNTCYDTFASTCLDTSLLDFNATTACSNTITASETNSLSCMYYLTVGSINYISLYDETNSAFSCMMANMTGSGFQADVSGGLCDTAKVLQTVDFLLSASCPTPSTTTTTTLAPTTITTPKSSARSLVVEAMVGVLVFLNVACRM